MTRYIGEIASYNGTIVSYIHTIVSYSDTLVSYSGTLVAYSGTSVCYNDTIASYSGRDIPVCVKYVSVCRAGALLVVERMNCPAINKVCETINYCPSTLK